MPQSKVQEFIRDLGPNDWSEFTSAIYPHVKAECYYERLIDTLKNIYQRRQ